MTSFKALIDIISEIALLSSEKKDSWSSLILKGSFSNDILLKLEQLYIQAPKTLTSNINFYIDTEQVSEEELSLYNNKSGFKTFSFSFNKISALEKGLHTTFFLEKTTCLNWFKNIDVLNETCPIYSYSPLCIYVVGLEKLVGNKHLYFSPISETAQVTFENKALPDSAQVKELVKVISSSAVSINPRFFSLDEYIEDCNLYSLFLVHSSIVLSSCVISEFYSEQKVVIDGIRRVSLSLRETDIKPNYSCYMKLTEAVSWIYEDKPITRRKLFNDRLTLDIDEDKTLIENLYLHAENSLTQARERYIFVITERKDAYIKELKDLLKDLRSQSDLYSQKIRALLNNFLRDLLASIILIGFTIFTKFSDNLNLDKEKLLVYVFSGLGIYYIVSIILQVIIDCIDINITSKELKYWKNASKELLPEREFERHYNSSLKSRRRSIYWLYPIISILYVAISFACFVYPHIFKTLNIQPPTKKHIKADKASISTKVRVIKPY